MTFSDLSISKDGISLKLITIGGTVNVSDLKAEIFEIITDETFDFDEMRYKVEEKPLSKGMITDSENGFAVSFSGLSNIEASAYKVSVTLTKKNNKEYTYGIIKDGIFMLSPATVDEVIKEMTPEEKASLVVGYFGGTPVSGAAGATSEINRLGIPALCLADGPQGVRLSQSTVFYPSGSLVASTWDRDTVRTIGGDIGDDCVKTGVDVILGPGMNVQRVTVGGRNFEYFSEDPFLTGKTASAYTEGVQKTGTGVALKHFACNNQESSRGSVSVIATERAVRDIYLRGFGYAVREQNPFTVMSSYNKVSGTFTSANKPLLNVLREEFGFNGLIMSDWGSGGSVTEKITAGNDLTEPGEKAQYDTVLESLKNGKLEEAALNEAVRNILNTVLRSNSYDRMFGENSRVMGEVSFEEHRKDALSAAKSGMVLMKNSDNTLPVHPESTKIAIFGDAAENTIFGGVGSGSVNAAQTISIKSGLSDAGFCISEPNGRTDLGGLSSLSDNCDLAVVVISRGSSEGVDIDPSEGGFYLTADEKTIITEVSEDFRSKNKKMLVILNTANPVEVESWKDCTDAILWSGFAGETTGTAVASVISGETNPSGKLTITWPTTFESLPYAENFPGNASREYYNDDIYVGYRYFTTFSVPVSFEFGFGLSYTNFEYSRFSAKALGDGTYELSVKVKNVGETAGREVVQFYVSKPDSDGINQPLCELCGYGKTVLLKPGKSETIKVNVTPYELETFVTSEMAFRVLPGTYEFSCGSSCIKRQLTEKIIVNENDFEKRYVKEAIGTKEFTDVIKPGYKPSEAVKKASIAREATVTCSGSESPNFGPMNVIDGNLTTRWSAAGIKDQWITLDLGEIKEISDIEIRWESNIIGRYKIAFSDDGKSFTDFADVKTDDTMNMRTDVSGTKTRYIKVYSPSYSGWFSIYEINVY